MKPHAWEIEEVDGGPVGVGEFWICRACGASGGPQSWYPKGPTAAWLAGFSLTVDLADCATAANQVRKARAARKAARARADRRRATR